MIISNELKLQLYLLDIKFQKKDIQLEEINWKKFFIQASNNRILYFCCQQIIKKGIVIPPSVNQKIQDEILPIGDKYIKQTQKALQYLLEKLPSKNIKFLVCKTQKIFDYITFDVDCLFPKNQYTEALQYLHSLGGKKVDCEKKLQADIIMPDMIRMDMHDGFHWHKSEFIPAEIIWQKTERKIVFGVPNCQIPSINNEIILTFLNLIYERHYVPLLDYHYFLNVKDKLDWDYIFKIAKENGWEKGLIILLNKFNQIHFALFQELIVDIKLYFSKYKLKKIKKLNIPYLFNWKELFSIFSERLIKRKYLPWFECTYSVFAKIRFHLRGQEKVPIYGHWIDFSKIKI